MSVTKLSSQQSAREFFVNTCVPLPLIFLKAFHLFLISRVDAECWMLELIKAICRKEPRDKFRKMTSRIVEELQTVFFLLCNRFCVVFRPLLKKQYCHSFFKKMSVWGISHFRRTFACA